MYPGYSMLYLVVCSVPNVYMYHMMSHNIPSLSLLSELGAPPFVLGWDEDATSIFLGTVGLALLFLSEVEVPPVNGMGVSLFSEAL
mgnify:CR=1 FL=1